MCINISSTIVHLKNSKITKVLTQVPDYRNNSVSNPKFRLSEHDSTQR